MLISLPPIAEPSDRQFMSDLYEQFGRLMYAKAIAYLDDPQDVDDLIQNCLEQLIKNVATLRTLDENNLTNYIAVTVRNAALNLEKRNDTKAQHSFLTDFEDDAPSDASAVPEEILLTREFSAGFWRVFKTLPEEDQLLLQGKYVLGLDDRELAKIFGCAAGSIRMKLTRARRRAITRLLKGGLFSDQTGKAD